MEETNSQKPLPYDLIPAQKVCKSDEPLGKVIGHQKQKEVLLSVINWFKKSKEYKERGVEIPRGILMYGDPGNGKSLLMKETIKYAEAPAFIFKGDMDNVSEGLEEMFKKAKETGHVVIVIDELDLLISKDNRAERVLQDNLDGVGSESDILVLCATNYIYEIPEPLKRSGRLEKILRIPSPTGKEAVMLLKKLFKDMGVGVPTDFVDEEFELALDGVPCASIKAIVNEVFLTNGFENISSEMIYNSIFNITNQVKDSSGSDVYQHAVHEAGHALMTKAYSEFFKIGRLTVNNNGGYLSVVENNREFNPHDKMIADIKISCAGLVAEKLIFKNGCAGCDSDMQRAYKLAARAINRVGLLSCSNTLPEVEPYRYIRNETEERRHRNEIEIEKLLKRCEKETIHYLKKNKKLLIKLADELFKKKNLKSNEVLSIIGAA